MFKLLKLFFYCLLGICFILISNIHAQITFTGVEHLGCPTDHSILLNIVADTDIEAYVEYGTASGVYTGTTAVETQIADEPLEFFIDGLNADTEYFYRLRYREDGSSASYSARNEYSFHTQRPSGSTFSFTITSDSHINVSGLGKIALYRTALDRINSDNPDFNIDLGDTFPMDGVSSASVADANYLYQRNSDRMGRISPSVPIFIVIGNHENEEGWNFDDINPQPIFSINARKKYFPTPITDGFYTGNTDNTETRIDGDHLREDYYAWEWGDALFVAFDPFEYTMTNPYGATAGEGNDDPASGDRWNWTLGEQQYNWLKQTLENSNAPYKFMFAHHMLGGTQNYVREGATPALWFEWGGYNVNSSNQNPVWEFDTKRPGWSKTIRQLMIDNGVTAFFHGHDHEYAYEIRDGIVYQELPSPSMTEGSYGFGLYSESDPYTIKVLPNAGYLRVTVSTADVTVDYINTTTGNNTYSYTIDNPLPVELTSFNADVVNSNVELSWETATEVNNYGFEVERSPSSPVTMWESIGFVEGHGNSNSPKHYQFVDDNLLGRSELQYRLKQIDNDGKYEYSQVVEVQLVPASFELFQNYPNPFNPNTTISFSIPDAENVSLKIFNTLGEEVATIKEGFMESGTHTFDFNAGDLASGVYIYRLSTDVTTLTKRMLLLK